MRVILLLVALYFLFLSSATMWATTQVRERTQCYREALKSKQYDKDCGKAGKLETFIKNIHEKK